MGSAPSRTARSRSGRTLAVSGAMIFRSWWATRRSFGPSPDGHPRFRSNGRSPTSSRTGVSGMPHDVVAGRSLAPSNAHRHAGPQGAQVALPRLVPRVPLVVSQSAPPHGGLRPRLLCVPASPRGELRRVSLRGPPPVALVLVVSRPRHGGDRG